MYIPEHFRETDDATIRSVIGNAALACLVCGSSQGLVANHVPLIPGPGNTLIGHVALANDVHRLITDGDEVLAIFRGAQGYVSPNYYPSKAEHHRHVPTWNYEAVHAHGTISFQHDLQSKRAAVGLLTRLHERQRNGAKAWRMGDAPADYIEAMLGNIVAFRIAVTRLLAKSKLSQNRDDRDYSGTIEGLRAAGEVGLAERMQDRTARRD